MLRLESDAGLRSLFAEDETVGIGNAGFGFAADYRFLPWLVPLASLIGKQG